MKINCSKILYKDTVVEILYEDTVVEIKETQPSLQWRDTTVRGYCLKIQ